MLTVGSLFSGIGGFDLGLERAGMRVVWQCESDPYCRAILARHWPGVACYPSVQAIVSVAPREQVGLAGQSWVGEGVVPAVDLLCGGFPCQPFSTAGKRQRTADARWLWPDFARVIRLVRPRYVLVENVTGLLHRGGGLDAIFSDLAALGFDAEWESIPAAAFGAPHLRDRVLLVAYAGRDELRLQPRRSVAGWPCPSVAGDDGQGEPLADSNGQRWPERRDRDARSRRANRLEDGSASSANADSEGQSQPGGGVFEEWRRPSDGGWWATEPNVGRVAHGVPSRVDRLRALGNAVVPQVAEWVGRQIIRHAQEEAA